MDKKYFIEIGGRPIDYSEILELVRSNPPNEPIGRITFTTKLNDNLNEIDLKDKLRVFSNEETILTGYVDEVFYSNYYAVFKCEGYKRSFRSTRVYVEFLPSLRVIPFKAFWFMARLFNEPENIHMDPKMITEANFITRDYTIVMPINNLELNEEVRILDVSFTNSLEPDDDNVIKSSNTFKTDKDWNVSIPKAVVRVQADNFYDAIMKGHKRILTVVNLISFRNDLSFIFHNTEKMQFKNSLFYSTLDPIMKVFCKEVESDHAMFYDLKPQDRTIWKSKEISEDYFVPLKDFEKSYTGVEASVLQSPIVLSIQWLAISIKSYDLITKLIATWNSLEFAISGLQIEDKFSVKEKSTILYQINPFLEMLEKSGTLNLTDKQKEIIMSKLKGLNDVPIIEKIAEFLINNDIPFNTEKMMIVKQTRKKRNDIQHGRRHVLIKEEELEKLRSLIEKILLKRVCLETV